MPVRHRREVQTCSNRSRDDHNSLSTAESYRLHVPHIQPGQEPETVTLSRLCSSTLVRCQAGRTTATTDELSDFPRIRVSTARLTVSARHTSASGGSHRKHRQVQRHPAARSLDHDLSAQSRTVSTAKLAHHRRSQYGNTARCPRTVPLSMWSADSAHPCSPAEQEEEETVALRLAADAG